jgi:hypothetical protein
MNFAERASYDHSAQEAEQKFVLSMGRMINSS